MKKIISLICILTLAFTMVMPMHFASADTTVIALGDETFEMDGVTYKKGATLFNKVDFEDGSYAHLNDGYNANNKSVDDFTTLTGAEADDDGHGKVMQIRGNADNNGQNTRLLSNIQVTGGVFIMNYDMYVSGEFFSTTAQAFSIATRNAAGSRTWNSAIASQLNYVKSGDDWVIRFTYPDGTTADIHTIEFGEWFNFTMIMDLRNYTFTYLIDGSPVLIKGAMKDNTFVTQDSLDTVGRLAKNGEYILLDNVVSYQYFPYYNATIKGIDADGEISDNIGYAEGTKLAVQFDTPMKASEFSGDVSLISSNDVKVAIKGVVESDYVASEKTLYITTEEAMQPGSVYTLIFKANSVNDKGETIYGVVSADNIAYSDDKNYEFTTSKTPYGIEEINYGSLTAGDTVNAEIVLRTEEAVDANLVLVLYADGKMRSVSSTPVVAASIASSYTLPINVPADGSEYKVSAMLLGTDYKVIDVFNFAE